MPQWFSYPLNYKTGGTTPVVAGDNDYNTGTTGVVTCDISDSAGAAQQFTHVFLKGNFTNDISMAGTGGTFTGVGIIYNPSLTDDSGDPTILNADGFNNVLFPLEPSGTATRLTFTTLNASDNISEVMVLNEILSISDNDRHNAAFDDIPLGRMRPAITGRLNYIPPIGNERDKNLINYRMYFNHSQLGELHALRNFIRDYKQFAFAAEYNRYPELVFPAMFVPQSRPRRYRGRPKELGLTYSFSVREI